MKDFRKIFQILIGLIISLLIILIYLNNDLISSLMPILLLIPICLLYKIDRSETPKKSIILLTVPHGLDDKSAIKAADYVYDYLKDSFNVVKIYNTEVYRSYADMNRDDFLPRTSDYRKKVDSFIIENKDNILWHLDIHSFPFGYFDENEMVFLDIFDETERFNYPGTIVEASTKNALEKSARNIGINSILIEFGNLPDDKIKKNAKIVADWMKDFEKSFIF
jgi:hypothetical protein